MDAIVSKRAGSTAGREVDQGYQAAGTDHLRDVGRAVGLGTGRRGPSEGFQKVSSAERTGY